MLHSLLTKIKAKRYEKNFSQYYMASRLEITQGYYNKLENGKKELSAKIMLKIFDILEIDLTELKPIVKQQESKT